MRRRERGVVRRVRETWEERKREKMGEWERRRAAGEGGNSGVGKEANDDGEGRRYVVERVDESGRKMGVGVVSAWRFWEGREPRKPRGREG